VHISSALEDLLRETAEYEVLTKPPQKLKELYNKCFTQAAYDGIPKHKIGSVVFKHISELKEAMIKETKPEASDEECQVNRSWFNECAHDAGVTDLKYSPVPSPDLPLVEDTVNSFILKRKVNQEAITAMRTLRENVIQIEEALADLTDEKGDPMELVELYGKKQVEEYFRSVAHLSDIVGNLTDRRTLVPLHAHSIFKACILTETSVLTAGKLFLKIRADILENVRKFLTQKQASKFHRGLERPQLPIYQPKNRDEAIYMDWYGLQCAKCESWRSREKADDTGTIICYDCDNEWHGHTVTHCAGANSCGWLFYEEDLKKIKRTGKCPNCKKSLRLPKSLLVA